MTIVKSPPLPQSWNSSTSHAWPRSPPKLPRSSNQSQRTVGKERRKLKQVKPPSSRCLDSSLDSSSRLQELLEESHLLIRHHDTVAQESEPFKHFDRIFLIKRKVFDLDSFSWIVSQHKHETLRDSGTTMADTELSPSALQDPQNAIGFAEQFLNSLWRRAPRNEELAPQSFHVRSRDCKMTQL